MTQRTHDLMEAAWRRVARHAEVQAGIVTRRQLYSAGLPRGVVRAQIRARRWRRVGQHSISVATGPLTAEAEQWAAVLEGGPRAFLDGASALVAAGLEHYATDRIRVSVPNGARIQRRRNTRADLRETRRWRADDVANGSGVPRARTDVAAIRGALWATSDRQAALVLTMSVQQGLCRVEDLAVEMMRIRRDRRRGFILDVLDDLADGARSLGELDVVGGCRARGLPVPDQQQLRRVGDERYFLDHRWDAYGLVVEVDGIQHLWPDAVVADALRHNSIVLENDLVLRLPVLGLRLAPNEFFGQITDGLRRRGWMDLGRPRTA